MEADGAGLSAGCARPAAVVIGRNEGARLLRCLDSLIGYAQPVIYVDSGSTDGSAAAARLRGASVVELDAAVPFTAARARNAGFAQLRSADEVPAYLQFVDGDCEVQATWWRTACEFLDREPLVAVVCGRLRERYPEASVYNRLCDFEWDVTAGEVLACGGIALMRVAALSQVDGFCATLIAGEEPELCVRLRAAGWRIHRLAVEMALHDAAITRFAQWWKRTARSGHAFAEGAALHGRAPERHWVRETRRALLWGVALPLLILALAMGGQAWGTLLLLVYPAQILRLALRGRRDWRSNLLQAGFLVLGRFPEALGVLSHWWRRIRVRAPHLIEYK